MAIRPAAPAPDWSEDHHRGAAKCRGIGAGPDGWDIFFEDFDLAMAVCNGSWDGRVCPRRTECLRVAMLNCENYGVWGGMTPADRLHLRLRYPGAPERWTWHPPGAGREPKPPAPEEGPAEWPTAA
ncbi:WhiB family transcriptional regulator [Kitasatospora purpeofusca]|uniref:WhiB family transcriptional regulator n=1 Tax=Kitasatospora purpeofusca TaxID=67352 RepID=UPI0036A898C0